MSHSQCDRSPTGFCGGGGCCQAGVEAPPCDGKIGCDGFQCCVDLVPITHKPAAAGTFAAEVVPAPPPSPPLSECAIARVQYSIGRTEDDALGDEVSEVRIQYEPWSPDHLVSLEYHEPIFDEGMEDEPPIEVARLKGASLSSETKEGWPIKVPTLFVNQCPAQLCLAPLHSHTTHMPCAHQTPRTWAISCTLKRAADHPADGACTHRCIRFGSSWETSQRLRQGRATQPP